MYFFLTVVSVLLFPVSMTIILTCQTLADRKRREQGLPPKKHHNIKDLNMIEALVDVVDQKERKL